jgi:hypothetical protein
MKKFIVELTGAGKLSPAELKDFAVKTTNIADNLEVPYHWIQTFITDNKLFCVHIAPDRETVLEHASQGAFPTDNIAEIRSIVDLFHVTAQSQIKKPFHFISFVFPQTTFI